MVVCFKCSRETKEVLDRLLQSGQYEDYAEIISIAVANLSVLESEIPNKGTVVIREDDVASVDSPKPTHDQFGEIIQSGSKEIDLNFTINSVKASTIPALFLMNGLSHVSYYPTSLPTDVCIVGQEIPIDRWVFGQYNRLLPAKASCRALARLIGKDKRGILLEEASQIITPEAAILGDYLKLHDQRYEIGRDDLLSTAFPTTEKNSEKSYLRYGSQFVGSVNREGQVSGLLINLKLVNRASGKKIRIHLTEPGWRFATMPNPVLDNFQTDPFQKFCDEEINFLIEHISKTIPAEDFAYRTIMKAIIEGANSPDSMDEYLQKYVMIASDRELSSSFLSTQRSGAVSRMTDLGLVKRVRDGVKVSYEITNIGKEYLEKED